MAGVYNEGKLELVNASFDWTTDGITVSLHTNTYVPDPDDTSASLSNELSGGNYAALTALASRSIAQVDASDLVEFLAQKATFPSLGAAAGTPRWAVIRRTSDNTLLFYVDLTVSATVPDGNNYEVRWNSVDGVGRVASLGDT